MSIRIVEVTAPLGSVDTLLALGEQHEAEDVVALEGEGGGRCLVRIVCDTRKVQPIIDGVQRALEKGGDWRLTIQPVEAVVPPPSRKETDGKIRLARGLTASREELLDDMYKGSAVDATFLILVLLSTIVAAIGMLTDNVAVIVGAMVIAPLLGPNLAFAFGTALGNRKLMLRAASAAASGIGLAIGLGVGVGLFWSGNFDGPELMARTRVGLDGVVLALASGAAAVLSMASGLSSALVGVMVAVALLPPATAVGLMLGAGELPHAMGAGVLLAVNVVCINLAAQTVFVAKGIKPRTSVEQKASREAVLNNFVSWAVMLLILVGAIWLTGTQP